jgi:transcriptional antiterminator
MVNKFEEKSLITLQNKELLFENLLNHIIPMYFRLKYSQYSLNPLLKEIKQRFAEIFKIVEIIMNDFGTDMKIKIPETEIGFITLYFASQIKKQEKNQKLKVVIVCDAGLATSNILKTQILNLFENIEVIDTLSQRELSSYNNEYDFIVSTIPIDSSNKIQVNYLLSDYDKKSLKEKFNKIIDTKNMRGRKPMLKELITKNMIQLNMEAKT